MPIAALLRLVALATIGAAGLAQQTLRVPSQFPTIQAAVAAAAPGDEVLLETRGPHASTTITKGISLRGVLPNTEVSSLFGVITILRIPPGQQAVMDGIQFHTPFFGGGVRLESGTATFDTCSFRGRLIGTQRIPALEVIAGNAALVRCLAEGSGSSDAVVVAGGHASITASTLAGGFAGFDLIWPGGVGLRVANRATVQITGSTVRGGDASSFNSYPGGPAFVVRDSTVWIADCVVRGGSNSNSSSGHGIEVLGASRVEAAGTVFAAGSSGVGGQAIVGSVQLGVPLLRPRALPRFAPSQPWVIPLLTRSNSLVAMVASTQLSPMILPSLGQPLWVDGAADVIDWSVTDAMGRATLSAPLPATLPRRAVWVQLLSWDGVTDAQSSVVFGDRG